MSSMRARRFSFARCLVLAFIASLALAGCGRTPAAPAQPAEDTPLLRIVADPVVTMTQGATLTLTLEERDAGGRIVTQAPDSYTWTSSEPGLVAVGAEGMLTAGPGFGQAVVTVRSVSGTTASARVWVQQPRGAPSAYRITLIYADNVPDDWRELLDAAAARWEEVIRAELPEAILNNQPHACNTAPGNPAPPPLTGVERGTRIFVSVSDGFPVDTYAEALGGPCLQRPLPHPTTILGRITLNAKKPLRDIPPGRRSYLALHEMGHALGLVAIVQGFQPPWYDPKTERYTGPMGLEGYRRDYGASVPDLIARGGHWPFYGDIMGGGSTSSRISWASAGALMDLGYPATWYGAHD